MSSAIYRTTLRPAHGGGIPSGVAWDYVAVPADVNRPDLPSSRWRYGSFTTSRPLTREEMEHFDIVEVLPGAE